MAGGQYKKVIGQQLVQVFPQAVSNQLTEVIPDIYQQAKVQQGWVMLHTDLRANDRVKIITEKEQHICKVLEVKASAFRLDFSPEVEEVFVYGREVDDFHIVDYDAVSMLNVSATQEIYRKVQAQQEEIRTLKAQNNQLEERLAKIESLLKGITSTNGVH